MSPTLPLDNPVQLSPLFTWADGIDLGKEEVAEIRRQLHIARSWRENYAHQLAEADSGPDNERYTRLTTENAFDSFRVGKLIERLEAQLEDRGISP